MSEFWQGVCATLAIEMMICGFTVFVLSRNSAPEPDDACPYCGNKVE